MKNSSRGISTSGTFKTIAKKAWKLIPSSLRIKVPYAAKVRIREMATSGHEARLQQETQKLAHTSRLLQQETQKLAHTSRLLQQETQKLAHTSRLLVAEQRALSEITQHSNKIADEISRILEHMDASSDEMSDLASLAVKLAPTPSAINTALQLSERSDLDTGQEMLRNILAELQQRNVPESSASFKALKRSDSYLISVLDDIPARDKQQPKGRVSKLLYILNNSLPYSSNGYATRSHGVIRGFEETDLDVVVYTRAGYPKDMATTENPDAVQPCDAVDGVSYHRIETPTIRTHFGKDYIAEATKSIRTVIEKERPAYVMAASNHRNALPALIAARECGLPFVYEVRGFWEITRASREPGFSDSVNFQAQVALESKTAQEADLVLTLNSGMKAELIKRGVSSNKILLLPNSVEPNLFPPLNRNVELAKDLRIPDGIPVIGYIGTFVDYEGLDDLSRACAILKEQGIEFRLLLVGNDNPSSLSLTGSVTDLIRKCADDGGFSDWLIMPGRVPFDKVRDYYSLVDIAPFPRKPWNVCELVSPLKPLESMIMGKPVVVSNVAALKDMVRDRETGLIFEKGNVPSLADVLCKLINSPDLRHKLGMNAREWVTSFRTWEYSVSQVAPAIKSLYDETSTVEENDVKSA
ncbi:glycosyltransferase [Brucella sp. BE17]|uniref:glycosyltransferase n=1 Tax=Brucella sp. BE17 TaxID=3142977 RepID=UPI0031BBB312